MLSRPKMELDINITRISDFIDRHISGVPLLEGKIPPFSSLEFSNNALCNRRCVFCPKVDAGLFPNKDKHLSFALFKKIMEELATIDYCGRISFSGFCEPLLTKDLEKYITFGKRKCSKMTIEISSNGDFLTVGRLKTLFGAGLDNIRLSLYDGQHQDEKFVQMKATLGLSDKQFIIRRRYLPPEEKYGLTISNRAGAIRLRNDKITIEPLRESLKQPCYYPFYKMLIDYNGDTLICSNDWLKKLIVGNVINQTIFEIWNSRGFNNVRNRLISQDRAFSPCNVCNVNGLYNGKLHFEVWIQYYKKQENYNL